MVTDDKTKENHDRPAITFDYNKFGHFLDEADLTEEQKQEYLLELWNLIVQLISWGIGVHPIQQATDACGQIDDTPENSAAFNLDRVKWDADNFSNKFDDAAGSTTDTAAGGFEE